MRCTCIYRMKECKWTICRMFLVRGQDDSLSENFFFFFFWFCFYFVNLRLLLHDIEGEGRDMSHVLFLKTELPNFTHLKVHCHLPSERKQASAAREWKFEQAHASRISVTSSVHHTSTPTPSHVGLGAALPAVPLAETGERQQDNAEEDHQARPQGSVHYLQRKWKWKHFASRVQWSSLLPLQSVPTLVHTPMQIQPCIFNVETIQ